jgi:hypothetical protein
VKSARRRVAANIHMIEDETLLEIDAALNFLLSRLNVSEDGEITPGGGDQIKSLENAALQLIDG